MKKIIFIIPLLLSLKAFGVNQSCSEIEGKVQVDSDGKLYETEKDGSKRLLRPTSTEGSKDFYGERPSAGFPRDFYHKYIVSKSGGRASTLTIEGTEEIIGFDGIAFTHIYELGVNGAGECLVKSVKDPLMKRILYDSALCENLSKLLGEMSTEVEKCSAMMSRMSAAVKTYNSGLTSGWKLRDEQNSRNPFEAALLFAADCRKRMGSVDHASSLNIQKAQETKKTVK